MGNPIFIPIPFAKNSANKSVIQKQRQTGQAPEDFTWNDGAPTITMTPKEDGGKAPKGQDFNGAIGAMCEHTVFVQNGGRYQWSNDVVTNYGGYSKGAIVQSDDTLREYISNIDNNTKNPNTTVGSEWSVYSGIGSVQPASSTTAGITKVLNSLQSTDVGSALSAAQGKVLGDRTNPATQSNVGIVQFANSIEIAQGANINKVVNPAQAQFLSIGFGQSWQNVTNQRQLRTTYTNNTGKPIQVLISLGGGVSTGGNSILVGGITIASFNVHSAMTSPFSFIVPNGQSYIVNTSTTLTSWAELR